jgi:ABC-type glycerol-3-phosphate transport system permease component
MNTDIRLIAIIVAILGGFAGYYLPASVLFVVTTFIIVCAAYALSKAKGPAEGGIGVVYLSLGTAMVLLVPLWVVYLVR